MLPCLLAYLLGTRGLNGVSLKGAHQDVWINNLPLEEIFEETAFIKGAHQDVQLNSIGGTRGITTLVVVGYFDNALHSERGASPSE